MAWENVESCVFRQVYNKLSTGIRAVLPRLAEVAFARRLIHDNTQIEVLNLSVALNVRTQSFLNALRDRIRADPSAFLTFVDILNEENSMEYLATMMKRNLEEIKSRAIAEEELKKKQVAKNLTQREAETLFIVGDNSPSVPDVYQCSSGKTWDYNEWHMRSVPRTSKPTQLPFHQTSDNNYHQSLCNKTPESKYTHPIYYYYYPGSQSTPEGKQTASPVMVLSTHSGLRIADSAREFNAPVRRAITPDHSGRITLTPGPTDRDTTKLFGNTYNHSDLHLALDLSSIPSPSGNPTTSPKECHYPRAVTESGQHPINPERLIGKFAQFNISNNVGSTQPPTSTSIAACDRKPSTANPMYTDEAKSCASKPQDAIKEHLGLNHIHGNGSPLTSDPEHHITSTTHAQENPQNKQQNSCGFEITTTAPTPQEPPPNQITAPLGNENKTTAKGDKSQIGCSGVTESQSTELGSNYLSCHQISRHPSLHSCSSVESNTSSTCDSAEINPVQASEENPGEGQPLVSGGIKPGGCSDNRTNRQNRQRCKHCTRLRKESTALKEELNKVQRTLSIERDRSNKQVDDLKEQIYIAQQNETGLVNQLHNIEQRHLYAERTIQKLQRELRLLGAEKLSLKSAYDACLARCDMLRVELQRADSLQCQDFGDDHCMSSSYQNPMVIPEQMNSYRSHIDTY